MKTPRDRRDFLKTLVAAGTASALTPAVARAGPQNTVSPKRNGVLVDTTVCVGCRNCEWACKTAHDLPAEPLEAYKDRSVFAAMRRPDDTSLTVVNEFPNPENAALPYDVKVQCMHCDHPACL